MQPEPTELDRAKNALWAQLTRGYPVNPATRRSTYTVDEHNAPVLRELALYMVDAPCQWATKGAGIALAGGVGTGKTDIMRAFSHAITAGGGDGFEVVSCVEIVNLHDRTSRDERENGGSKVILLYGNKQADICFDDLGEEPEGKHFGSKRDVIPEIITLRYKLWKLRGFLTHFTTNVITNEALFDRYGQRTADRILEMARFVPLPGPSRRSSSTPAQHDRPKLFELPPPQPTAEEIEAQRVKDKAQFDRIRSTIAEARMELAAETPERPARMEVVKPSIEKDLIDFESKVMQMTDSELDVIQEKISLDASEESVRFMDIVAKEIEARRVAHEQEENTPAA
jgi:DNA replication protein DnaC